MIYVELLWSFFQIGLFSIGGGYAAMPLIQHQVVDLHPWLTMTQFADIMTIAEMTPGPIAINAALIRAGNLHLEYGPDFEFIESADLECSAGLIEELYLRQGRWWLRWGVFCPPASL